MNINTKQIIDKLPNDIQNMILNSPHISDKVWSKDWNDWMHQCIFELNKLKVNGVLTREEWDIIHQDIFKASGRMGIDNDCGEGLKFFIGI